MITFPILIENKIDLEEIKIEDLEEIYPKASSQYQNKKDFEEKAKTRIKTGLILNEFGEKNQIKVTEQEIQAEVQKQLRMMPGQEKMVMDFYQKNPSALASLRGTVYEEKILNLIKEKGKANKKEIANKLLIAEILVRKKIKKRFYIFMFNFPFFKSFNLD